MEHIQVIRVSGEGQAAKFDLYVDGKLMGERLNWTQLREALESEADE